MRIFEFFIAAWRRRRWARLTPGDREVIKILNGLSLDDRDAIKRELAADKRGEFLRRSMEEFAEREERAAAERRAQMPEIQRKHKEWVDSLMAPKAKKKP